MKLIENYKSTRGEIFAIFVNEYLEPSLGDYEGLYFEVVSSLNKGHYWNCVIKISGTLQAVWSAGRNKDFDVYSLLRELGTLKIKQAIEKIEPFLEFMFTTYTAEKTYQEERNKLVRELEKLQKKEPLIKESKKEKENLDEIS